MPFLPSGTGQPANEGFQRGWNMIMNLYGKKKIDEQAQQQQQQFDQRFGLQKQAFEQESKVRDLQLKENTMQLKALERKDKIWQQMDVLDPESPTYKKDFNRLRMLLAPGAKFDNPKIITKTGPQGGITGLNEQTGEQVWQTGPGVGPVKTSEQEKSDIVKQRQTELAHLRNTLSMDLVKWKAKYKKTNPDTLGINDRRILDKDLTTMAMTLDADPVGPGAKQAAQFFNDYAVGTSVYLNKKGKPTWGGLVGAKEETVRVDLPVDPKTGIQITASDIRKTLKEEKTLTLEKLLKMIGAIE